MRPRAIKGSHLLKSKLTLNFFSGFIFKNGGAQGELTVAIEEHFLLTYTVFNILFIAGIAEY